MILIFFATAKIFSILAFDAISKSVINNTSPYLKLYKKKNLKKRLEKKYFLCLLYKCDNRHLFKSYRRYNLYFNSNLLRNTSLLTKTCGLVDLKSYPN